MKSLKKEYIKNIIIPSIIILIILISIFSIINIIEYNNYKQITNQTIANIINEVLEKYPDTDEEEIIKILNGKTEIKTNILSKYGYTQDMQYIKELEKVENKNLTINIVFIAIFGIVFFIFYTRYFKKQDSKVAEINEYIKEINNKNYKLRIEENKEDELSKLRNELYKTTILLRETAENSEKERKQLENSLADISHQIKTPLTSITIMLDNIYENPQMDEKTKAEFIQEISKQIEWISSLVITLLKLAKFDSGTITMNNNNVNVKQLLENVISNLSIILDVKNVEVILNVDETIKFIADYKWQLEALTNIVKNSIEHSKENSKIYIDVEDSSIFLKIKVKNYGDVIDKKDLKHIFERFYKTKTSR